MYLEAPSSITDLMLIFNFGISTTIRTWNIKVSMIPCGANFAGNVGHVVQIIVHIITTQHLLRSLNVV